MTTIQAQIDLNAQQATQEVDQFSGALNKADKSTKNLNKDLDKTAKSGADLERSLKQQEARIKSLDGTINLVGGSVELLAGTLVTFGITSEENAAKVERFALGALNLADGAKRVFDGFRSLSESTKLYNELVGENTTTVTKNTTATNLNAESAALVTASQKNAAGSIAAETTATGLNTGEKSANTIATKDNANAELLASRLKLEAAISSQKATLAYIQERLATDLSNKELRKQQAILKNVIRQNEQKLASTIAGTTATQVATVAEEGLTVAQKARNFVTEKAILLGERLKKVTFAGYVGIAIAIASLISLFADWGDEVDEVDELYKELNKAIRESSFLQEKQLDILTDNVEQRGLEAKAIKDLKKEYPGFEAFLTRENALNERGIEFLKLKIQLRKAEAGLAVVQRKQVEEEIALEERIAEIRKEEGFTTRGARFVAEARAESRATLALLNEEEEKYLTLLNQAYIDIEPYNVALEYQNGLLKDNNKETSVQVSNLERYQRALINIAAATKKRNQELNEEIMFSMNGNKVAEERTNTILKQLPYVTELEKRIGQGLDGVQFKTAEFVDYLNYAYQKQLEFFEGNTSEAISNTLQVATNFTRVLRENVDETTKEGFDEGKKYRIAETRVATIQAAFEAYKGLIGVPYVGQVLAIAGASAALIAGNKAIQDIKASSFNDTNSPSNPVAATPISQRNLNPQFGQGGFLAPQSTTPTIVAPEQPIQAYVLASDVTLGLQAYGQIGRRRRFG